MNYIDFARQFAPIIQVFGSNHYPDVVMQLIFMKTKDLSQTQLKELINELIINCKFAPKVPDVIEQANIVRARHRDGVRDVTPMDDGPRTPEVARRHLATIHNILSKKTGGI